MFERKDRRSVLGRLVSFVPLHSFGGLTVSDFALTAAVGF